MNTEMEIGDFLKLSLNPPQKGIVFTWHYLRESQETANKYTISQKKNYEQYSCKHIVGLNKYIFFIKLYPKVIVTVQLNGCLKIGIKGLIIDATFWFVLPVIPILKKYTRSFREQFFSVRVLIKEQKKHP